MIRILTPRPLAAIVAGVALGSLSAVIRVRRVVVEGASMAPTVLPGDRLAVLPLPPRAGRLVVVGDPRLPARLMVKRCVEVHADGSVSVAGDNSDHSTDSRHFGSVPSRLVIGRPVYRYAPPETAGTLWGR